MQKISGKKGGIQNAKKTFTRGEVQFLEKNLNGHARYFF